MKGRTMSSLKNQQAIERPNHGASAELKSGSGTITLTHPDGTTTQVSGWPKKPKQR
jgi:hypothetical protein